MIGNDAKLKNEKELNLYVIRHGRTLFNMIDRVQGFSDSPLTQEGVIQALRLGENLKDIEFITAFTSDLGRQRATAKHILSKNKKDIPKSIPELYGLREWNFGGFEGGYNLFMSEAVLRNQNTIFLDAQDAKLKFQEWIRSAGDRAFSNALYEADPLKMGEKYDDVLIRIKSAMDTIISESLEKCSQKGKDEGNVLIISSGCLIRTLLFTFAPETYHGGNILNCSVSLFNYKNGKFTLKTFNDMTYADK
ncbi:MAG: histidine phosphatase family protein [Elusimicrobiota bacterium]|jgi:probable phosphoglycerate mutase|nr:histidine phosphatase family protein [Elusimicrobiota bacterium]